MLLYIHVPFCRRKCRYCAFYSVQESDGGGATAAYAAALLRELAIQAGRLGPRPVETIFFGGGTPSLLPPEVVQEILAAVRRFFPLAPDAEISLEANPESALLPGRLAALRRAGVTRLSLGVQSFNDADLALLGRPHSAEEAAQAARAAKAAGFLSVSLDLIWGLPGQTPAAWLEQVDRAAALPVDHISAYCLTLEEGTPLSRQVDAGEFSPPGEEDQAAMFLQGIERLAGHGFLQYETANFARPAHACRHNLGYWQGKDYLGLGPSAVSTLNGRRYANPADLTAWQEAVEENRPPPAEVLTPATLAREMLMLALRTTEGLDLAAWEARAGRPWPQGCRDLARRLEQAGLARQMPGGLRLTPQGLLVSNAVLERFFQELPPG